MKSRIKCPYLAATGTGIVYVFIIGMRKRKLAPTAAYRDKGRPWRKLPYYE